ncbi:hypothetical protein L1887_14752 [Cichorium endivia]|nr:hypothetical protein L1887_14752 [Cichorium endivia]
MRILYCFPRMKSESSRRSSSSSSIESGAMWKAATASSVDGGFEKVVVSKSKSSPKGKSGSDLSTSEDEMFNNVVVSGTSEAVVCIVVVCSDVIVAVKGDVVRGTSEVVVWMVVVCSDVMVAVGGAVVGGGGGG